MNLNNEFKDVKPVSKAEGVSVYHPIFSFLKSDPKTEGVYYIGSVGEDKNIVSKEFKKLLYKYGITFSDKSASYYREKLTNEIMDNIDVLSLLERSYLLKMEIKHLIPQHKIGRNHSLIKHLCVKVDELDLNISDKNKDDKGYDEGIGVLATGFVDSKVNKIYDENLRESVKSSRPLCTHALNVHACLSCEVCNKNTPSSEYFKKKDK